MSDIENVTPMLIDDEEEEYISRLKFRQYKFNWIIEDFDLICKTMKIFESPRFPSTKNDVQWYFKLYPVELKEYNNEMFNIHLCNTTNFKKIVKCQYSILNAAGIGHHFFCNMVNGSAKIICNETGSFLFQALQWNKMQEKKIKLVCKLNVFDSINNIIPKPLTRSVRADNLLNQIEFFFDDQTFKDVTFKVEDKEFNAHKIILILRSPVFAAMFQIKMTEELTSIVKIEDIKSTIFQKMLRFIYTDKVNDLKESAAALYYAAEKYQLEKLKTMCINSLCKNLSSETVIETLKLAEMFSIFDLKQKSLKCLVLHLKALEGTHSFVQLVDNYPHICLEIKKVQITNNNNNKQEDDDGDYCAKIIYEFKV
ncbi:speckle-type POZ protein-like [Leptopilina boulardi]|uniref:speckle-type POZ protein-like n=1 Tax=Leptopilina boulardi TaxID=63433 RepID=UPI0021F676AA|nr:speckle-type POZ protein-like [Leptopilina boulardi]XP_051169185.1 speckle-type POZ protein-like [Leptopilina boulardi]